MLPQDFIQSDPHNTPPPDVAHFRTKRACNTAQQPTTFTSISQGSREPGEVQTPLQNPMAQGTESEPRDDLELSNSIESTESPWMQPNFRPTNDKLAAVREFAAKFGMKEDQVRAALDTADHIRRSKIAAASTLDQSVFTFSEN